MEVEVEATGGGVAGAQFGCCVFCFCVVVQSDIATTKIYSVES